MWLEHRRTGTMGDGVVEPAREDPAATAEGRLDQVALGLLYREHAGGVYGYLLARTASPEDAADLTQQVFAQALAALPGYRRGEPPAAWLFSIARNLATDAHRRRRSTVPWELVAEERYPAADADPEAEALRGEAAERVRALLAGLDARKREILLLRFAGGLTMREVAAAVGKSEAAVKMEIGRTLRSLKEYYRED
jgi:RNA polymerase sigma-70 factor (ECF subfamily)